MISFSPPVIPDVGPDQGRDQAGDPKPPQVVVGPGACDTLGYRCSPDTPQADEEEKDGWLFPSCLSDAPSPPPTPVQKGKSQQGACTSGSPG